MTSMMQVLPKADGEVFETVLGVKIVMAADSDDSPRADRLGSVSLVVDDVEDRLIVRIYGVIEDIKNLEWRTQFEKEVRLACEQRDVLSTLFNMPIRGEIRSKRFNPSRHLKNLGWHFE